MEIEIIKSKYLLEIGEIISVRWTNKNKVYLYGLSDLSHRNDHRSGDVYIIDPSVKTSTAITMAKTIFQWDKGYQKPIIIATHEDTFDAFASLKIKGIFLQYLTPNS